MSPAGPKRRVASRGAGNDLLKQYLTEISRVPLLDAIQERKLANKVRRGDEDAREALISANLRLVVFVAKRFANRGMALLDLIEEGNLGLIHAVSKFKPAKGFRFSTYATWWIRQSIQRGMATNAGSLRLPIHVAEAMQRMARAKGELLSKLGREPTNQELAKKLAVTEDKVRTWQNVTNFGVSLDSRLGPDSDSRSLLDTLADTNAAAPDAPVMAELRGARLRRLVARLPERERNVMTLRYGIEDGNPLTLQETGELLGLTRERIRQIEVVGLRRLRASLREREDI